MKGLMGGGSKGPDYAAIEADRKRAAEAAEVAAKEEAYGSELERIKTQRGRAATILNTTSTGKGTLG